MEKQLGIIFTFVKRYKICILSTYLFGLMAHGFSYFNLMFNHDGITVYQFDGLWKLSLGRCFVMFFRKIRKPLGAPFLEGILTLFFIAVISCCICALFEISSKIVQIVIAALLSTNYSLTLLNATYIHDVDSYFFGACSFTIAACFCTLCLRCEIGKTKKAIFLLSASCFVCLGLGMYQAFIPIFPLILMMVACIKCLSQQKALITNIKLTAFGLGSLTIGGVIYKIILSCLLKIYNISLAETENGINTAFNIFSQSLGKSIISVYQYYINFIFSDAGYNNKYCVIALLIIMILVNVTVLLQKLPIINKVMLILIQFTFPLVANGLLLASGGYFHHLMIYQYVYIVIWCVILISRCEGKQWAKLMATIAFAIMIFNNVVFANDAYLLKKIQYDNTYALVTRIITRVEEIDGFIPGETPIIFLGEIDKSPLTRRMVGFDKVSGTGLDFYWSITYTGTVTAFMDQIYNYPSPPCIYDSLENVPVEYGIEQIKNMPVYPNNGSIVLDNGKVFIKLSDL